MRPVPDDRAEEAAAQFPPYELRTEPAHEEAFIQQDAPGMWASDAHAELAMQTLLSWATEHHRQPLGSGAVRMVLVHNPANGNRGPDTQVCLSRCARSCFCRGHGEAAVADGSPRPLAVRGFRSGESSCAAGTGEGAPAAQGAGGGPSATAAGSWLAAGSWRFALICRCLSMTLRWIGPLGS